MISSIFSVNVMKSSSECLTRLCKIPKYYNVTQVAFMKRLSLKQEFAKPPPYPYWKKQCTGIKMFFDLPLLRYDENTKLIVVDGPPAVGKTKLCEKLAEEFGMLYMPSPTHDEIYIDVNGFDMRSLDVKLPPNCQSCDLKRFLTDPHHVQVPTFQLHYFMMRFEQYTNALLHILASGQGVILNRSVYSDVVFTEAMHNAGYISKKCVEELESMKKQTLYRLLRPHLIIYLDAPPEIVLEKIKKRGNIDEVNSKVLTIDYLSDLDKLTKEKYLPSLAPHSHMLLYDWSKEGNYLDVVSDIELLDLEEKDDTVRLQDWIFLDKDQLINTLALYQDKDLMFYLMDEGERVFAPEFYMSPDEQKILDDAQNAAMKPTPPKYGSTDYISSYRHTPRDFVNCDLFKPY